MTPIKSNPLSRRRMMLDAGAALAFIFCPKAGQANMSQDNSAYRYKDPQNISPDDIAWFRKFRSVWIEAESGAPALYPPEATNDNEFALLFDEPEREISKRLDRVVAAFFLHARFLAGSYTFKAPFKGRTAFDVNNDHIKLLRHTNWRWSMIDPKRPYGDYVHYEIDMARALGLPIYQSAEDYDEIGDVLEKQMDVLHQDMEFVLQAYIENAQLEAGTWFLPFDGLDGVVLPRCTPPGSGQINAYKGAMAILELRALYEEPVDLVVPRLSAQIALFNVE